MLNLAGKNVLFLSLVWPEPTATAAGTRTQHLLNFFKERGARLYFGASAQADQAKNQLKNTGVLVKNIKVNDAEFDDWLQEVKPDWVVFDRFISEEQYGWRIDELFPNAIKILDTQDLHCLRLVRERAFKKGINWQTQLIKSDVAKREIAAIYRCDISLIISRAELNLLRDYFKVPSALYSYFPLVIDDSPSANSPYESRKGFMSIGNFKHAPNADAVRWLKKDIWPRIRAINPKLNIHIYGAYISQEFLQMHKPSEGFYVHGFIPDVNVAMQSHKVLLAPLRFGAGQKGKFFDAIKNGLPSVTTPTGSEGITDDSNWFGEVCDSVEDFVKTAVELYTSQTLWEDSQNTTLLLRTKFDSQLHYAALDEQLTLLQNERESRRSTNFTGQLLKFHTMRSTKYMSKWIEEKNR